MLTALLLNSSIAIAAIMVAAYYYGLLERSNRRLKLAHRKIGLKQKQVDRVTGEKLAVAVELDDACKNAAELQQLNCDMARRLLTVEEQRITAELAADRNVRLARTQLICLAQDYRPHPN